MILGVDVSRYQPKVDWQLIKAAGVEFVFIKATQGDYSTDPMLEIHAAGANAAGLAVGLYHWCDPLVSYERQAAHFLKMAARVQYSMLAADVEQQWADWNEWAAWIRGEGSITKYLTPETISENAKNVLAYLDDRTSVKTILYTRASFIHSYARPMLNWCKNYPLWLAHYPYANGRVAVSWEEFKTKYLPLITAPDMPMGCTKWHFWQFTGDKFLLPGLFRNDTDLSPSDVNFWSGNLAELHQFAGVDIPTPEPEPEPEPEQPPEEKPPMGTYDSYAKGVLLQHTAATPTKAALAGADFLVIETGWGTDYYPEAAERVGLAADVGVPAILHYKMDAGPYQSMGYDVEKWPKPDLDLHVKTLDRAVFMGGVVGGAKRKIAAILFDMTYNQDATSKVYFTETWMAGLAKHLTLLFWERYKIPVYWLCTQKVLNDYGNKANGPLATLFTGQPMSCIKMAFTAQPETVSISTCAEILPPPQVKDSESGQMVDQKPDYLYGSPFLWQYTRTKFSLSGVQVPALLYWGKREKLYAELKFTPAGEPEPEKPEPEKPEPEKPQPGSDYSALVEAINANTAQLKRIADYVTR